MIVGLTSAARVNPYAVLLIDELAALGVPASFVLSAARGRFGDTAARLRRRGWSGAWRALRRRTTGAGVSPLAEAARDRGLDLAAPLSRVCHGAGVELVSVADLGLAAAVDAVRTRRATLLINAGGGLFRAPLRDASERGILNAHMACLPAVRGVDVLEWSLLLGVEPGVTVHWIDAGVDTGEPLTFGGLTPVVGDTLESLRERAVLLSARLLAAQVAGLAAGGSVPTPASAVARPQYFALHPRLRARAAQRIGCSGVRRGTGQPIDTCPGRG